MIPPPNVAELGLFGIISAGLVQWLKHSFKLHDKPIVLNVSSG